MSHNGCVCNNLFRFEATDIQTGQIKAVVHPISISWEDPFSSVGSGQIQVATREYRALELWPKATGLYITRQLEDGTYDPDGLWGGYIEKYNGAQGGTTSLGMQGINQYLWERLIADEDGCIEYSAKKKQQTQIGADLVNLAKWGGLPITAFASPSKRFRDRTYHAWDCKNIGEAIEQLTQVIDGVTYKLEHKRANGFWNTEISFYDEVEIDRNIILKSDREGWEYGVDVDAKDQATRVYAVGSGEESAQLTSTAYDAGNTGPEWHRTQAWKDVSVQSTLDDHAMGYVADYRDPLTTPSLTIAGMDPDPDVLKSGDTITADIEYGLVTFKGKARIINQTWALDVETPVTRALTLLPKIRPALSVKLEPKPAPPNPGGGGPVNPSNPEPKPGLVTRIKDGRITESSMLALSVTHNERLVYTADDENEQPQIFGISLTTGETVTTFHFPPAIQGTIQDPECMAVDPSGRIWFGDTGDNDDNRPSGSTSIIRTNEPAFGDHGAISATRYPITLSIGSRNVECLLINPISGSAWLVTKESGGGHLLRLPNTLSTGGNVAQDQHKPMPKNVSDGCYTKNGKWVLFRRKGVKSTEVWDAKTWKKVGSIKSPDLQKGESITMDRDGKSFLIGSEGKKSPIFRVVLPTKYR